MGTCMCVSTLVHVIFVFVHLYIHTCATCMGIMSTLRTYVHASICVSYGIFMSSYESCTVFSIACIGTGDEEER